MAIGDIKVTDLAEEVPYGLESADVVHDPQAVPDTVVGSEIDIRLIRANLFLEGV
jgi:hypothetical protein